jgi:hypothetical protein
LVPVPPPHRCKIVDPLLVFCWGLLLRFRHTDTTPPTACPSSFGFDNHWRSDNWFRCRFWISRRDL